jgi:hypothetical protein
MLRRDFLKSSMALAAVAELGTGEALGLVRAHNWGNYDFGSGPSVSDRLNQGPFPQYAPDAVIPTDDVVMTTTASEDVVPNFGKGLITYITAIVALRKLNRTISTRRSRTSSDFLWVSSFTYARLGERCSRGLGASSCLIT